MDIPDGWKTAEQAAAASGYSPEEIRRWARRIRPDENYTDAGLPPGGPRAKSMEFLQGHPPQIVKGSEIKRLFKGRIIIADAAVAAMVEAQGKLQELRSQGARTAEEIAEKHGVSVKEVMAADKRVRRREARAARRR